MEDNLNLMEGWQKSKQPSLDIVNDKDLHDVEQEDVWKDNECVSSGKPLQARLMPSLELQIRCMSSIPNRPASFW
jgi:hypothetical protein